MPEKVKVGDEEVPVVGEATVEPPWRQIIIETDGNNVRITKAEIAGNIELAAILRALAEQFDVSRR